MHAADLNLIPSIGRSHSCNPGSETTTLLDVASSTSKYRCFNYTCEHTIKCREISILLRIKMDKLN